MMISELLWILGLFAGVIGIIIGAGCLLRVANVLLTEWEEKRMARNE